ncbi:MAG: hypothetical protein GF353_29365 [Candidatus Lokiarchaeota archaeon]|nr:hypothetical protein [Candidatus Lokiarchaeota archaeon]
MVKKVFLNVILILSLSSIFCIIYGQEKSIFITINTEERGNITESEKTYLYKNLKSKFNKHSFEVLETVEFADYRVDLNIEYNNRYIINSEFFSLTQKNKIKRINEKIINKKNKVSLVNSTDWMELFYEIIDSIQRSEKAKLKERVALLNKQIDSLKDTLKQKDDSIISLGSRIDNVNNELEKERELKKQLKDTIKTLQDTLNKKDIVINDKEDSIADLGKGITSLNDATVVKDSLIDTLNNQIESLVKDQELFVEKWAWILISIIVILFILTCILAGYVFYYWNKLSCKWYRIKKIANNYSIGFTNTSIIKDDERFNVPCAVALSTILTIKYFVFNGQTGISIRIEDNNMRNSKFKISIDSNNVDDIEKKIVELKDNIFKIYVDHYKIKFEVINNDLYLEIPKS